MEIVGAVATMVQCFCGECHSHTSPPEQCSYLRNPQAVMKILEHKTKSLVAREADLRTELHDEKTRRGLDPTAEVNLWLDNVQTMKTAVANLGDEIQENKKCLCGCFPNYYKRVKFGNNLTKKMHEVDKLLQQRNFSGSSLVNMIPQKGKNLPTRALIGGTAKILLKRIWECLIYANDGIIGVYGMGGVGKTSIVKEINNKLLLENTHFDDVIWITASKDCNIQKLQKDIAREIGLSLVDGEPDMNRTSKIFEALIRRRRFLLIIDDLWDAFSLEDVGIPSPTNVNGCKLLLTTRSLSVCRSMETDVDIEVRVLTKREAWCLFKLKVGEEVLSSPRLRDIAKIVADECGGLPLALITVGRALRKEKEIKQWQFALNELRNSTGGIEGMQDQVNARLRFSYDRLKDDTSRACFLYCALYPEDHLIETEELIKYWAWEGLLGNSGSYIVRMQVGEMILNELKSACMLESVYQDGCSDEYVKMHDSIRDMIIALTRANSVFMVKSGRGLRVPPAENEWLHDLERVSLMRNDLSCLSHEPKCPKLHTLLLQYNSISKGIFPMFFQHMQSLKILDLSYTGIHKLPESLSNLEGLHTLILQSCWNLCYIPTLKKLKELTVFDLSYSSIDHLPEGMEMLVNLQHLNLSFSRGFEVPLTLLPNFKFLESLFLIGPLQFGPGPSFIDAISKCNTLIVLEVNFSRMQDFDDYIISGHWSLLKKFSFFIGHYDPSSVHTRKNSVGFYGVDIYERLSPVWLTGKVLELEICECQSIISLPLFITAASSQLQCCNIKLCDQMEFIINPEWCTFPNLELLEIEGLSNLRELCRGITAPGTLASLTKLHVVSCNFLKTLIPLELLQHLRYLAEIIIEDCERIVEVIGVGNEGGEITEVNYSDVVLSTLRRLKLSHLPELKYISRGLMLCDSLSTLEVARCPDLERLSFFVEIRQELVNSLKQIQGSRIWWKTIRRNHRNATDLLYRVFRSVPDQDDTEVYSDDESLFTDGSGSSSFGPR